MIKQHVPIIVSASFERVVRNNKLMTEARQIASAAPLFLYAERSVTSYLKQLMLEHVAGGGPIEWGAALLERWNVYIIAIYSPRIPGCLVFPGTGLHIHHLNEWAERTGLEWRNIGLEERFDVTLLHPFGSHFVRYGY